MPKYPEQMTLKEYLEFLKRSRIADTEEGDGQEGPINDPHATAIHEAGHVGIDAVRRGRILALMAGRAAEEECLGSSSGMERLDDRWIGFELDSLGDGDTRLDRMRSLARGLVRKHRAAIERVAAALERDKVLDGETIRQLVRGLDRGQPGGA